MSNPYGAGKGPLPRPVKGDVYREHWAEIFQNKKRAPDKHSKLMSYMRGWKIGAGGSAFIEAQFECADFKQGWNDGRTASKSAYASACVRYDTELLVLRAL